MSNLANEPNVPNGPNVPSTEVGSPDVVLPAAADVVALRREALLPAERRRGMGSVTMACTMAGLASGLALATTLMAMQVAENINTQRCPGAAMRTSMRDVQQNDGHGYLGVRYTTSAQGAVVDHVFRNTPADDMGLRPGDLVESVNGYSLNHGAAHNLARLVWSQPAGAELQLVVIRDGARFVSHPLLEEWPTEVPQPRMSAR